MAAIKQCEVCGYIFDMNLPAVDASEAPYYTHVREVQNGTTTDYLCSSVCMDRYIEGREHTEPRGPDGPSRR